MKGEFYKMDYEAWDAGTDGLSLELEAAYLRVCHQMYRRKAPVANEPATLARIWRCHQNKARKILAVLIEKGKLTATPEGHLTNTRVTQELDARETMRTQRQEQGHTGGIQSGVSRRKALISLAWDEALASTSEKPNEAEKEREEDKEGEERRGERAGAPDATLTADEIARVEAAFGPDPDEAQPIVTGAKTTVTLGPKRRHPPEAYLIDQEDGFRILHADVAKWQAAFTHLDVAAELLGASGWVINNFGPGWYHRIKTWLAGKNVTAKADHEDRRLKAEAEAKAAVEAAAKPPKNRFQIH